MFYDSRKGLSTTARSQSFQSSRPGSCGSKLGTLAIKQVFSPSCSKKRAYLGELRLSLNCATFLLEGTSEPQVTKNIRLRLRLAGRCYHLVITEGCSLEVNALKSRQE